MVITLVMIWSQLICSCGLGLEKREVLAVALCLLVDSLNWPAVINNIEFNRKLWLATCKATNWN